MNGDRRRVLKCERGADLLRDAGHRVALHGADAIPIQLEAALPVGGDRRPQVGLGEVTSGQLVDEVQLCA